MSAASCGPLCTAHCGWPRVWCIRAAVHASPLTPAIATPGGKWHNRPPPTPPPPLRSCNGSTCGAHPLLMPSCLSACSCIATRASRSLLSLCTLPPSIAMPAAATAVHGGAGPLLHLPGHPAGLPAHGAVGHGARQALRPGLVSRISGALSLAVWLCQSGMHVDGTSWAARIVTA